MRGDQPNFVTLDDWMPRDSDKQQVFDLLAKALGHLTAEQRDKVLGWWKNTSDRRIEMTQIDIGEFLKLVDKRKSELDSYRPLPQFVVASLRNKLALDWTYNSNAIEGNTLSLRETKAVLEDGITIGKKTMREHFEAINHRDAILFVEKLVSGDEAINSWNIRNIHALVLKNIDDANAGRFREWNVLITGASHIPPSHLHLNEEMRGLENWYATDAQALHPIDRAAQLHTRFVGIHPFDDGNGRTSRLLLNMELMKNGYPIAIIRQEDRAAYYDALDKSCAQNDFRDFTRMVAEAVARSQDLYLEVITGKKPVPLNLEQQQLPCIAEIGNKHAYKQVMTPASPVWSAEQEHRAAGLESIKSTATGALLTFAEIGADAVKKADSSAQVDWRQVEDAAIAKSLKDDRQPADDVYRAIASASPGALTDQQQAALRERIDSAARAAQSMEHVAQRALETLMDDLPLHRSSPGPCP